jgi:hypothetical protein
MATQATAKITRITSNLYAVKQLTDSTDHLPYVCAQIKQTALHFMFRSVH